eukprot:gene10981-19820_t
MANEGGKDSVAMNKKDKEIVEQFCMLLAKSTSLFEGLRDLPQFCHSHWQSHFGKAFDVYTKLWKFQQEHSLRTSEANYLFEAFQFYSAIRTRNYFNHGGKDEESSLLPKKLRYYARFLVVCLLMNETNLIRDLTKELKRLVNDYTNSENAADHIEWQLVLKEIVSFVEVRSSCESEI